jgi:hypothetical protein
MLSLARASSPAAIRRVASEGIPEGVLWNVRFGLVRFCPEEFDSLSPLFGIGGDKGSKFV